ncbi:MAG: CoA-binding protein [Elusimicrobiota bacterium]|jgi:predicted CoA-binding protein|nr:CoA-binding protein [Elusimicrobiota bacterium]
MSEVKAEARVYAVAGNSADTTKYWYRIFKDIKDFGLNVYCINPFVNEVDGLQIYPDLGSLPQKGTDLILVARPEVSAQLVDKAIELGYRDIYFQPGTYTEEAAAKAQRAGIEVHDYCFMVAHGIW